MHKLTLGDYKGLDIASAYQFKQADLDKAVIESVLNAAKTYNKIYNPIEKGDRITLRVEAKESGLIVPELCNSALEYVAGDEAMLPQFSEAIGKKQGEKFVMKIPFAEKCPVQKVQGKVVDFESTITNVEHVNQIPIDNSLAPKLDPSCETLDQIKQKFAAIIKANYDQSVEEQNNDNILEKIGENCQCQFDPELFKETLAMVVDQTKQMMQGFTMPTPEGVSKDEEEAMFAKDCQTLAEKMIRDSLIIQEIAQTENIVVTPEELAAAKAEYTYDEESTKEFKRYFSTDEAFGQFMLRDKVLAFLRAANLK